MEPKRHVRTAVVSAAPKAAPTARMSHSRPVDPTSGFKITPALSSAAHRRSDSGCASPGGAVRLLYEGVVRPVLGASARVLEGLGTVWRRGRKVRLMVMAGT
jgi:hypothetical protein